MLQDYQIVCILEKDFFFLQKVRFTKCLNNFEQTTSYQRINIKKKGFKFPKQSNSPFWLKICCSRCEILHKKRQVQVFIQCKQAECNKTVRIFFKAVSTSDPLLAYSDTTNFYSLTNASLLCQLQ